MKGVQDLRARDVMIKKPLVLSPERRLLDAVRMLVDQRVPGAPVVDERGSLVETIVLLRPKGLQHFTVSGHAAAVCFAHERFEPETAEKRVCSTEQSLAPRAS